MQNLNLIMINSKNLYTTKIHLIIFIIIIMIMMSGCNKISEGQQRKKFEFLYKMNNNATLFREYTNEINYFSDLEFYEGRMKKLTEDINKADTVQNYTESDILKLSLLNTINVNINMADSLRRKSFKPSDNIREEYEVIIMNDGAEKFMTELNDEISRVGKE